MADDSEYNSSDLLKTCLDFCQLFVGKQNFFFNVSIGDFNCRVNHSNFKENISEKNFSKKKYVSPSTRRRNNLRLLAFKARRAAKGGAAQQDLVLPPPQPGPTGWGGW